MLAGCLERGQRGSDHPAADASPPMTTPICRANNAERGSTGYVACRKDRDVQREQRRTRAPTAPSAISAEQMLNNPVRP